MLVDSMVKDIDGYLLNRYNSRKLVVKVRTFSSAKTIDMKRLHQTHQKRLQPRFIHITDRNKGTSEVISNRFVDTAKSVMTEKTENVSSNVVLKVDE